jgi:hypothetical protein
MLFLLLSAIQIILDTFLACFRPPVAFGDTVAGASPPLFDVSFSFFKKTVLFRSELENYFSKTASKILK